MSIASIRERALNKIIVLEHESLANKAFCPLGGDRGWLHVCGVVHGLCFRI